LPIVIWSAKTVAAVVAGADSGVGVDRENNPAPKKSRSDAPMAPRVTRDHPGVRERRSGTTTVLTRLIWNDLSRVLSRGVVRLIGTYR
jgi:hypothetical protein